MVVGGTVGTAGADEDTDVAGFAWTRRRTEATEGTGAAEAAGVDDAVAAARGSGFRAMFAGGGTSRKETSIGA